MAMKILAVDDDSGVLDFYKLVLEKAGFTVRVAADATAAIMLCVDFKPDLILLDWDIPGGGGKMVFEKICGLLGRNIPVLFVTGSPEKVSIDKLAVKTVVLKKPVTEEELLSTAGTLLK